MGEKVTFNGSNKIITVNNGETDLDAERDIYSAWKRWKVDPQDNSKWLQALRTVGGDPIGGTQTISPYFFLLNGWTLRPYEGNHRLIVSGNLFVDGGGNPFIATVGNYNVLVELSTSPQSITDTLTVSAGSGLSQAEHDRLYALPTEDEVTTSVWSEKLSGYGVGAGKIQQLQVFGHQVILDTVNGFPGTDFPIGTGKKASNNLADALTIANSNGLHIIECHSNVTIANGQNVSGKSLQSHGIMGTSVVLSPGCSANNTAFRNLDISGTVTNGDTLLIEDCQVGNLTNFTGIMNVVAFSDGSEVTIGYWANMISCTAGGDPGNEPEINIGTGSLNINQWTGNLKLTGKTGTDRSVINCNSGNIIIDPTCLAGKIQVLGVGQIESDNSGPGCIVDTDGFITIEGITQDIWSEKTAGYVVDGTFGAGFQVLQTDLKKALGLLHQNIYIDNPVYDGDNNLTSARVRIYSDNVSVGSNQNVLAKYVLSATSAGAGKFSTWSQITSG